MSAVTQWFPPDVKPTRVGVYQVAEEDELDKKEAGFQYWNGKWWGIFNSNAHSAFADRSFKSIFQDHHWRGLTEKSA